MSKISEWNVKRAGAGMTVTGKDENGHLSKVTRVVELIGGKGDGQIAVRDTGERFQLA